MHRHPLAGLVAPRPWTLLDYYLKWSPAMRLIGRLNPRFDLTHIPYPEDRGSFPEKQEPKRCAPSRVRPRDVA